MDNLPSIGALLFMPVMLVSFGWYVAVIVFLYKIWQKVKHLPG